METRRVSFYVKCLAAFLAALVAEYALCGIYFRLIRHSDFWKLDLASALAAAGLCYGILRKFLKAAVAEGYPSWAAAVFFLAAFLPAAAFLRFSAQLVNGLLDFSEPQDRVVYVTDKKVSALGGSFREGPSPMAHLLYFGDWDGGGGTGEVLALPALYYSVDAGTALEISVRSGFFGMPWVQDFRLRDEPVYPSGFSNGRSEQ